MMIEVIWEDYIVWFLDGFKINHVQIIEKKTLISNTAFENYTAHC